MVFTRTCSPSSSSVSQCVFYAVVLPSQCKGTVLSIVLPERVETGQCVFFLRLFCCLIVKVLYLTLFYMNGGGTRAEMVTTCR